MDQVKESDCDFIESAECASNKNMGEDSGFSSTNNMTPNRQNKGVPKTTLKIKLFDNHYNYETEGNESILEMVERMLGEVDHQRKPNVNRMLFKTLDDSHLNFGTPTGQLKRGRMYECIFRGNSKINTTDYIRKYNVTQFCDDWEMNYFDVKFDTNITVGYMQSVQNVSKFRVHYFPEETLYEALYRDGRFEKSKNGQPVIRSCDFMSVDAKDIVVLTAKAEEYAGQCFTLRKRNHVNSALPENVPELDMPSHLAVLCSLKKEPETPVKSNGDASQGAFQPFASSTPFTTLQVRKLQSFEDLQLYVEEDLGLKLKQERGVKKEDQRNRKIEKFLKEHYQNFALDFPHAFGMSDLEHFVKLKLSVGAVIAVNVSGVPRFWGTCSRIGKKYVLTNQHVYEKVKTFTDSKLSNCYVNFDYKGKNQERHAVYCFIDKALLFSCKDLDYAIMELDTRYKLPESITDLGFNIPPPTHHLQAGENLSLIGHPNGMEQMVNMSCPIKPDKQIEDHLTLALHHLEKREYEFHCELVSKACNNPNTAVYDVSNFFWGSSGSPGVLIEEKLFVVLHRCGVLLRGTHVLEEGTLMSSIVEDVIGKLKGSYIHPPLTLDDIFGKGTEKNFQHEPMEID